MSEHDKHEDQPEEHEALALIHEIAALERDSNDEFGDVILDGTTDIFNRIQSLAARTEKPALWFTVWVAERSGQGTHFVQAFKAGTIEEAKQEALAECAACWQYEPEDVRVLGVVAGDATVLEWDDEEEG